MKTLTTLLYILVAIAFAQGQITVGNEFQVNTYTPDRQYQANVDYDANGNFVVVWTSEYQDDTLSEGVFAQLFDSSGTAVGTEFQVNTFSNNLDQFHPDVVMSDTGNFVVVWASDQQDGHDAGIYFQRFNSNGVKVGSEVQANTTTAFSQNDPSIDMSSTGAFVVSWMSFNIGTGTDDIVARTFNPSGIAQSNEILVFPSAAANFATHDVAVDAQGNFVVVYHHPDIHQNGVYGQLYQANGTPINTTFKINTTDSASQDFPSVAMDYNGNFAVAFHGQDSSGSGIFVQRYSSTGAKLGGETWVNTDCHWSTQTDVDIAMDSAGNFTVVWKSWWCDGNDYAVMARRYDAAGSAHGPEFQVNTFTTGSQGEPNCAMRSDGAFIVVWQSVNQDGDNDGVFAQRYSHAVPVGIHSHEQISRLMVYPNPTSDVVNVEIQEEVHVGELDLIDLSGRVLQSISVGAPTKSGKYQLALQSIPAGMYLIRFSSPDYQENIKVIRN